MRVKWGNTKRRWSVLGALGSLVIGIGILCLLAQNKPALLVAAQGCHHPLAGVVTADYRGRLGNNLGEYATIYAFGIRYGMTAMATPRLLRLMVTVFPFLSLPVMHDHCLEDFEPVLPDKFEEMADEKRKMGRWKIDYYPNRIRLFWHYREQLRQEFRFRQDLTERADSLLRTAAGGRTNVTFIGVHVRRTDYARHLDVVFNGSLLNESFYLSALDLCRRRYQKPVFIVTSDDLDWCSEHLAAPDVHILGEPLGVSPGVERDLALLAACNHTIFDYGTFGFFAAFLAGGDIILADGYSEKEHEVVQELRYGQINATYLDKNGALLDKCVHCL